MLAKLAKEFIYAVYIYIYILLYFFYIIHVDAWVI